MPLTSPNEKKTGKKLSRSKQKTKKYRTKENKKLTSNTTTPEATGILNWKNKICNDFYKFANKKKTKAQRKV